MRHFSGEFEGIRPLMADELDLIAGGEGEDTDDVPADAALDPCQINFLRNQLQAKGMPNDFLGQVTFKSGLDGAENMYTAIAWLQSGTAAVTQGNTIYVKPELFNDFVTFQNKAAYEEVFHAAQFRQYGDDFYSLYGISSVYGGFFGAGMYDGNQFEINAKAFANQMQGSNMSCGG